MNKILAALTAALFLAIPVSHFAAASTKNVKKAKITKSRLDQKSTAKSNPNTNLDLDKLRRLSKKHDCREVVMYREVLPYFGRENTIKASKEITTQFERKDLAEGRAMILDEVSKCQDLIGNFYVLCTTDTALCYFNHPKKKGAAGKAAKKAHSSKKK